MIDRQENKVITLVGDGECHEGTIWESALVAQSLNLTNLCCIVDYNGSAAQILPHPSIAEQWRAFGWSVVEVNGHDPDEIETVVKKFYDEKYNKPLAVIANTVKGYGVEFMQAHGPWHYKIPSDNEYRLIMEELFK